MQEEACTGAASGVLSWYWRSVPLKVAHSIGSGGSSEPTGSYLRWLANVTLASFTQLFVRLWAAPWAPAAVVPLAQAPLAHSSPTREVLCRGSIAHAGGGLTPIRHLLPGELCCHIETLGLGPDDLADLLVELEEEGVAQPFVAYALAEHAAVNEPLGGADAVIADSKALVAATLRELRRRGWDARIQRESSVPEHYCNMAKSTTEDRLLQQWSGSSFSLDGLVGEEITCYYCKARWRYEIDGLNGDCPSQHRPGCPSPGLGDNPGTAAQAELAREWRSQQYVSDS